MTFGPDPVAHRTNAFKNVSIWQVTASRKNIWFKNARKPNKILRGEAAEAPGK